MHCNKHMGATRGGNLVMKTIFLAAILFTAGRLFAAAAAYDIILSQRPDSGTGPNVERRVTPTAVGILGFDASKHPINFDATTFGLGLANATDAADARSIIGAGTGSGNVTGSSLTANAVVLGAGSNAVSVIASLGTSGAPFLSAGAGAPPAFGPINLAGGSNIVTGPLPVNVGGTGAATLTANNIITGNGTGAVTFIAPGTSGNVVTSNGTAFNSTAPTWFGSAIVSGCTTVTANSTGNITFASANANLTITTDNTTKTVTFNATGGGGGSGTVSSGTLNQFAYYSTNPTGTTVSSSTQLYTDSDGSINMEAAGSNQEIKLKPTGTGYFHSGAGAYQLGSYSVANSLQNPYAKTDTTGRNALMVSSNDASNPFGFVVNLTGAASDNNRTVTLSATDIGLASENMNFQAHTYGFQQQNSSSTTAFKITPLSTVTTLEAVPTNAGITLKPNGSGFFFSGAGSRVVTTAYNTFQYPFAKTDTTARNVLWLTSNDASNPFGLFFSFTGNATATSRIVKIGVTEDGVNSSGRVQLDGTQIELYGASSTLSATATSTQLIAERTTAATTSTDGALYSKGGLSVAGNTVTGGTIKTAAPSGGTASAFKIGAVATVTPTAQNRTIEIEINGTTFYLTAKTTND